MNRKYYVILYTSAVTGNACSSACPTMAMARKEMLALQREGAKNVRII